jgi:hypothetical protein
MTAKRAPWLGVALLHQLLGDNEPLVGDLIEECPHRSRAWFWRQVLFAVLARAIAGASASLREPQRLAGGLTSFAMFIVLSFQVVVAGSLLDDLIQRLDLAQVIWINRPEWLVFVVLLSLPAAWVIGRAMSRLHWRFRVATVLVCGASAAIVAAVTLSVLRQEGTGFFFPSAARQTAAAMVFVLALLVGGSSSSLHDRQASS